MILLIWVTYKVTAVTIISNHSNLTGDTDDMGYLGTTVNIISNHSNRTGDTDDMGWMYDQVIDTRKQLESLKHLLLKDITDDEKVPIL